MITVAQIKQELLLKHGVNEQAYIFAPASKYAYYNPAKKDKNGNVVVRQSFPFIWLLQTISTSIAIPLALHQYLLPWQCIAIGGIIFLVNSVIYKKGPKPQVLTVNKTGITIDHQSYRWEDYIGLYLFFYAVNKEARSTHADIVLIKADGTYTLVDISRVASGANYSKVATPLRDFQPESYKNSLPSQLETNDHS
jgi:hypothetical protein